MKKIFTLLFLIVAVSISAQKVNLTRLQDSDTDKWGLVNARGDWVIKPIFDAIYSEYWFFNAQFDPPFAVVKYKNKIGCIDQKGKWVVKPVFPAEIIGQDLAYNAGQQWSQQQPLGKALYPLQDTETEKYGFVNAAGNWAILPQFDAFSYNYAFNYKAPEVHFAVVKYKGKWGAINKKGEWIVKPVYVSNIVGQDDAEKAANSVAESSDIAVPASQVANYYDKPTNGFQWEGVVEKTKSTQTTTQTPPITTPSAQTTTPAQTTTAIVKPPTLKIISPSATATYDLNKITIRYEAKKSDGSNAEIIIAIDGAPLNTNTKGVRRASDEIEIPLPTKEGIRNIALTAVDTKNDLHSATQYLSLTFKGETSKPVLRTLAVGVGKYSKDKNINELPYAAKDAIDFANTIKGISTKEYREIEEPVVLTDEKATAYAIRTAFNNLSQNAQEDVVILYFSGHGEQAFNETYYLSYEAEANNLLSSTVNFKEIDVAVNLLVNEFRCKVIVFMDACHAGALGNTKSTFQSVRYVNPNAVIYSSCTASQKSLESKIRPNSVFTAALLDALNGKAKDKDLHITTSEVYNYIKNAVHEETNGAQTPTIENKQGEFILF